MPEHGGDSSVPYCWLCDHDRHTCPGCGDNLDHGEHVCSACSDDVSEDHQEVPDAD